MKHTSFVRVVLVASLFAFAACGDDGASTPTVDAGPADASPACAEATQHSDFTWIKANIFQKSCANFTSCHGADATIHQENLHLTADLAFAQLVNVASGQVPGKMRVQPNSCADSYLYNKLSNMDIKSGTSYMPASSPKLCQEKIDAVCRWIEAGAQDN
jgi:hypothetical protein